MKQIISIVFFSVTLATASAQSGESKGFDKSKLFTGGGLSLSLGTGYFEGGLNPHFGYSLNKWLDVAVCANFNYTSETGIYNDKIHETVFGPGAFARVFPVHFLYVQAQFEQNYVKQKYLVSGGASEKYNSTAPSFLLGVGYTSNRSTGENTFYYFSVFYDLLDNRNSPYIDTYGRKIPVIKAGFNIALFQGNGKRRHQRD